MTQFKYRLIYFLLAAWRRRYVICLPILCMPVLAGFVSLLSPVQYRSHTSMLIQETAKMNPFLQDIAVSTQFRERISALSTLLKSRHVLYSVAKEQGLIDEQMSNKQADNIIRLLAQRLSVEQLGKEFVQISLISSQKEGMKELLQSVSNRFIEQVLAPERASIRDSSAFLTIHIKKRLDELNQAEHALAEYRNKHPDITTEMQSENLSRLAMLKQTLAEKQAQLAGVRKSLGTLDQQLSRTNPVVGKIEEQIINVRGQLTLLRAKYTDQHSKVQAKQQELERLQKERTKLLSEVDDSQLSSEQLWDIASRVQLKDREAVQPLLITQLQSLQLARGQFESLKEETHSLRQMIRTLTAQTQQFGGRAKELFSLQRAVDLKRRLHDELVERYEMAQLTGALGVFEENKRVKIIDLPYTPTHKSNLSIWMYLLIGFIAGVLLGSGCAVLLELLDNRVRYKDEINEIMEEPVLTVIPR